MTPLTPFEFWYFVSKLATFYNIGSTGTMTEAQEHEAAEIVATVLDPHWYRLTPRQRDFVYTMGALMNELEDAEKQVA